MRTERHFWGLGVGVGAGRGVVGLLGEWRLEGKWGDRDKCYGTDAF